MKFKSTTAAILMSFLAAACDKAPNLSDSNSNEPSKQNESPASAVKSYRFKSNTEQCDTYQRTFETQLEMCYAVQIDELNNNCAATERLAFFTQTCADQGVQFDPNQAAQKVLNVDGNSVDCTLSESNLPTIRHFTGSPKLIMEHTSTRAIVLHSALNGKISLRLLLVDIATNQPITQIQKTWQDEAESLTLSSPSTMGSPVLTCLVSLAQDPTRE